MVDIEAVGKKTRHYLPAIQHGVGCRGKGLGMPWAPC